MASKLFTILLILPILPTIYAQIRIDVVASEIEVERSVDVSGRTVDIISEDERNTFRISDSKLKNAIRLYFGEEPDDVFVRSPTPWGDLYLTHNWRQVSRTLRPQKVEILDAQSQQIVVFTMSFINNSPEPVNFTTTTMSQTLKNKVLTSWENNGELTIAQENSYEIKTLVKGVGGNTTFSFTSKWGEPLFKFETVTVGSKSPIQLPVGEFSTVKAELYATRSRLKVQVDYEASLSGEVAVNYAAAFNGHHFWALDINNVMNTGGLDTVLNSTEVIDLDYYSNSFVTVRDFDSKKELYTIPILET